ncbi:hypothetical protein NVP1121O_148 [Vibrio phage 1.121.O._10N.286.46.C4]|nr:hypothetical protein NVP1121O_148 [Vibrio phage 1.121.O._10N.286.46.C4]
MTKYFIKNDHGTLRDLFLQRFSNVDFGEWDDGDPKGDGRFLGYEERSYLSVDTCEVGPMYFGFMGEHYGDDTSDKYYLDEGFQELTLQDFAEEILNKGIEVTYKRTSKNIFELKEEFESGSLYTIEPLTRNWVKITDVVTLGKYYMAEKVYIKKDFDWTDNLDGTVENGVWCWVWDSDVNIATHLVLSFNPEDKNFPYVSENFDWKYAKPMSKAAKEEYLNVRG